MLELDLSQYTKPEIDLIKKALASLKPPEKITVVDWVNKYGVLPFGAEPGPYSTNRAKYVEGILFEATNPRIEQLVIRKSAQTGITTALLQHFLYSIDCDPGPGLYVMPTEGGARDIIRERLDPLLMETKKIQDKLFFDPPQPKDNTRRKKKQSSDTLLFKRFRGGQLNISGTNSPSNLASRFIRYLWLDEVDKFAESAKESGDPANLAIKRTQTFKNRKIFWCSTPTVKGLSRITKAFEESDQRYYKVPCRHCGEFQVMEFENINYINDDPATAHYACLKCGSVWSDLERWDSVLKGYWEPTKETKRIAGFQLNELMSSWATIERIVTDYLVAVKGGPELMRTFTNETLGLPFNENIEETPINDLFDRKEDFDSQSIPNDVVYLVLGTDTQDHSLHSTLVGFGQNQETYVLDHFIIQGSPGEDETFDELEKIRTAKYRKQNGELMSIAVHCQDSAGHFTEQCYRWSAKTLKSGYKSYAVKSIPGNRPIFPRTPSRSAKYKGLTFYSMGSDTTKQMTFDRIKIKDVGKYYIHFGKNLSLEYFQELTNEYPKYTFDKRGKMVKVWIQRGKNEAFDCLGLCWASLYAHLSHYQQACSGTITPVQAVRKSSYLEKMRETA